MRILLFSNATNMLASSYGKGANTLRKMWQSLGHYVEVLGHPGLHPGSTPCEIDGVRILPMSYADVNLYSQDAIAFRAEQMQADVVFSFMDLFVLHPEMYPNHRHVCYFPVDTDRMRGIDAQVLKKSWANIAFSQYARNKAKEAGIDAGFIPLAVDTTIFRPMDRNECRKRLNLGVPDDAIIFGTIAANKEEWGVDRKGWHQLFGAFRLLLDEYPGKPLYLYVHSFVAGGVPLLDVAKNLGIENHIIITQQHYLIDGVPDEYLALVYNACDGYVTASKGEGFCLPLIEAQACAVPVICGDWTALSENHFAGHLLPINPCATLEPVPGRISENCYRYRMSEFHLAAAMSQYINTPYDQLQQMKRVAFSYAQNYSIANVTQGWKECLAQWETQIASEKRQTGITTARVKPKADEVFEQQIIRAKQSRAQVVIVCPSYGERCGIAEYTGYQIFELYKAGIPAVWANTVQEAVAVARECEFVKTVILHHEYSLYNPGGNERLSMGEDLTIALRQLKELQEEKQCSICLGNKDVACGVCHECGSPFNVAILQHTVATDAQFHETNCTLANSGIPLYTTSAAGAKHLSQTTGVPVRCCPLGTWEIPGFVPKLNYRMDFENINDPVLTIGNFGMLGPQRDIPAMIEVAKKSGSRFYGSFACDYKPWQEELRKLFADNGVEASFDFDWPDDLVIQHRLSACDVLYMPRRSPVFYSSASVLSAMNARRPIIANNDSGYADITDVLCIADTSEEAAAWVERLRNPEEYAKAVAKIDHYLKSRNLVGVLKGAGIIA